MKKREKTKFTDQFIRGLKPEDKRYIYREDAPRGEGGFCIRVMPTGSKSWQMIYTFEGNRKWLHLGEYPGMSLSQAREEFRSKRKILAGGQDPGEVTRSKKKERRDSWTIDKLADEFLEKYAKTKKRPRSAREDELNLKRDIRPNWGKRKARDIRRGDVISLLDEIVSRGAGVQANRTLATVRKMFAWGLEREVVELNPAAGISKPAKETPKKRALSLAEIIEIWEYMHACEDIPKGVKKALKLLLLTGCRPGEVLSFKWEQLDGDWLVLPGDSTKNELPHRVYLSTLSRQIIGDSGVGLILTKDDKSPIAVYDLSYWIRRHDRFGIERWTSHDLRRTCSTRLAEMGTAPHIVDKILNHVPVGITAKVYDQYTYSDEISGALEAWGRKVNNATSKQQPTNLIPLRGR